MPRLSLAAAAVAVATTGAVFAAGHSDVNPAVKARQSHMTLYAFNIGTLGGMAQGQIEYDAETARAAAENLAAVAGLNQDAYWVAGTSNADIEGTKALPAIWETPEDYAAKEAGLAEATAALAAVAGDGLESLQGAIGPVGQACGACHRAYRQRDE